MSPEQKAAVAAGILRARAAKGDEWRRKQSEGLKRAHAKKPGTWGTAESHARAAKKTSEKLKGRKLADTHVAATSKGLLALREDFPTARPFALRSPDGRIWRGKNLRCFVRDHESLFLPQDLNWDARAPRAVDGLYRVMLGKVTVWKGWVKLHGVSDAPPTPTRPRR